MKALAARVVRQSPALVIAMVALFVALTGTAVATTSALITGAQIKNSSITGLDVKNRSLTPRDFRGSVRGPRGPIGPEGPTGVQGPQGARGPSTAIRGDQPVIVGEVPDAEATIGHISLPAGDFVIFAKAAFVNPGAEALVECKLTPTGSPHIEYDRGNLKLLANTGGIYDTGVVVLIATTFGSSFGGFDFRCDDNNRTVQYFDQKTRAIQVDNVQQG